MLLGVIMVGVVIISFWSAQKVSDKVKSLTSTEKAECLTSSGCLCGSCDKKTYRTNNLTKASI